MKNVVSIFILQLIKVTSSWLSPLILAHTVTAHAPLIMTKLTNEVKCISQSTAWAKEHFSQSLPRGELWTVLRLALAHTQVDFGLTVTWGKETTLSLPRGENCSPFSSSSYGYWVMHHFICQFCHTYCMLKVLKLTQSQLARVRKKQHFSQSLPCGELWTVLRLALAHTVTEICTTSFVNFVILIVC